MGEYADHRDREKARTPPDLAEREGFGCAIKVAGDALQNFGESVDHSEKHGCRNLGRADLASEKPAKYYSSDRAKYQKRNKN